MLGYRLMSDIVEQLRMSVTRGHHPTDDLATEAAVEIERLRMVNADLLMALREIDALAVQHKAGGMGKAQAIARTAIAKATGGI